MKGFMRQRGESWELRVFLGYDPVSGKQRYATRSVRGGKREAQRVLRYSVLAYQQYASRQLPLLVLTWCNTRSCLARFGVGWRYAIRAHQR